MGHGRKRTVGMDYGNSLPHKYVPEQRQTVKESCGCRLVVHDSERQVINFEAIGEVTDALSISVRMGDDYDLVPPLDEALRELVNVAFHTSHVGVEKVRHHAYIVGAGPVGGKTSRANPGRLHGGRLAMPTSSSIGHTDVVQASVLKTSRLRNVSSVTWNSCCRPSSFSFLIQEC